MPDKGLSMSSITAETLVNFIPEVLHVHGLCSCQEEESYCCPEALDDRYRAAFTEALDHLREAEEADQDADAS